MNVIRPYINKFLFKLPIFIRITLISFIFNIKLLIRYIRTRKRSFSQFGEDILVLDLIEENKIQAGRYLDIGCYHPRYLSNTHILHLNGWTGLGIDLSKEKIDYFVKLRKGLAEGLVRAIVPETEKQKVFKGYFFEKIWSEIDTLSEEVAISKKNKLGYDFRVDSVQAMSINKLLRDYGPFDFMNIDIEGLDKLVLSNMDMKLAPQIILFENNTLSLSSPEIKLLHEAGYKHEFSAHISHCFIKEKNL